MKKIKGFTIIEVMVVIVIFMIFCVMISQFIFGINRYIDFKSNERANIIIQQQEEQPIDNFKQESRY